MIDLGPLCRRVLQWLATADAPYGPWGDSFSDEQIAQGVDVALAEVHRCLKALERQGLVRDEHIHTIGGGESSEWRITEAGQQYAQTRR